MALFRGPDDLQTSSLDDANNGETVDANNNAVEKGVDVDEFDFGRGSGFRDSINRRREFGRRLASARMTHRALQRDILGTVRADLRESLGKTD